MKDRVSLNPGRVLVTPEDGSAPFYATLTRADNPTQEGDPLGKATLLKDETAAMYGFGGAATPNDVFQKLAMPYGYYGFDVTVRFSDGFPVPKLRLNGLQDLSGNTAMTDDNGKCSVAVSESKTPTVTISDYIGVVDAEITVAAEDGVVFTPVTITLERDTSMHLIQSSQVLRVLPGVPVDMCIVGGGAAGVYVNNTDSQPGGGGGYVKNILNVTLSNPDITLTVGAGGAGGTANGKGGTTSITYDSVTETVSGGQGATGNGNGAASSKGTNGTIHVFNDASLPLPGGGGGASQYGTYNLSYAGGADFGGNGAGYHSQKSIAATPGTGPGGGGGGGLGNMGAYFYPAAGAAGGLYIRVKAPGVSV